MEAEAPAIDNKSSVIDLPTMEADGLVSSEEASVYLQLRRLVEMCEQFGHHGVFMNEIIPVLFNELNVFCIYLLVPEALNKVLKEVLTAHRTAFKILEPGDKDATSLLPVDASIYQESADQIKELWDYVKESVDSFIERNKKAFDGIDEKLKLKYEPRYNMVQSTVLKIKADFLRYHAEILDGKKRDEVAQEAKKVYEEVAKGYLKTAEGEKSPYYQSAMLNYCVLLCDVLCDIDSAISVATECFESIMKKMTKEDYSNNHLATVVQLTKDNISLWKCQRDGVDSDNGQDFQSDTNMLKNNAGDSMSESEDNEEENDLNEEENQNGQN
ncbi:MAG: hypothetical protein MHPSP_003299 [Paramarteilia canceri]